jgi:hypothetical protein
LHLGIAAAYNPLSTFSLWELRLMDFRFYKALPEPQASVQLPPSPCRWMKSHEPTLMVLALERTNDPRR